MEDGSFLSYEQLLIKYPDCLTWMEYNSLKDAIPRRWKEEIKKDEQEGDFQYKHDILKKATKVTPIVYSSLINSENQLNTPFNSWAKCFPSLEKAEYQRAFEKLYRVTISTKLRDFQYRLLLNRIPSNKQLHRWKIKNSAKCDFCDEEDGVKHMLMECSQLEELWRKVKKHLESYEVIPGVMSFEWKNIVLNDVYLSPRWQTH